MKTAYVVEDDPSKQTKIAAAMEQAGYKVTAFKTVDEALEHMGHNKDTIKVSKNLPTVVVTDNETGFLSYKGIYLAEVLQNSAVPCVMHSSSSTAAKDAQQLGAMSVIKYDNSENRLPEVAKQAIESLALHKLNIIRRQGGYQKL